MRQLSTVGLNSLNLLRQRVRSGAEILPSGIAEFPYEAKWECPDKSRCWVMRGKTATGARAKLVNAVAGSAIETLNMGGVKWW